MNQQKIKIIVAGESGVGKSSLITRYTENKFDDYFIATIGIDFFIKQRILGNKSYKLHIWDLAGQERFRSIVNTYYRNGEGILLMYDITNTKSFNMLENWLSHIRKYAPTNAVILLIGTKLDQNEQRTVTYEQAEIFAKNNDMVYVEISSKDDDIHRIEEIIDKFIEQIQNKIDRDIILNKKRKQEIFLKLSREKNNKCCPLV